VIISNTIRTTKVIGINKAKAANPKAGSSATSICSDP
jgi:hypothetical protein